MALLLDEVIEKLKRLRDGWGNIPFMVETQANYRSNIKSIERVYDEQYDVKKEKWAGGNVIVIKGMNGE